MRSAARKNIKKRGTEKGRGHAPENGCSACGAYDEGVSVPAFRRPETEGHDCHGTCMQAGNPDCGADDCTGCNDSGTDTGSDESAEKRDRYIHPVYYT